MEFGVQFFPSVGPDRKSAEQYWGEALQLTQHAEQLGYASVRTVEHYFHPYGGYSPDPLIFLSAAAAITRTVRLITGAVSGGTLVLLFSTGIVPALHTLHGAFQRVRVGQVTLYNFNILERLQITCVFNRAHHRPHVVGMAVLRVHLHARGGVGHDLIAVALQP